MHPCSTFGSIWWIFPVIIFAIVVVCLIRIGRGICNRPDIHIPDTPATALEILNKRYAQGEIGKEEYEEKKKAITERS